MLQPSFLDVSCECPEWSENVFKLPEKKGRESDLLGETDRQHKRQWQQRGRKTSIFFQQVRNRPHLPWTRTPSSAVRTHSKAHSFFATYDWQPPPGRHLKKFTTRSITWNEHTHTVSQGGITRCTFPLLVHFLNCRQGNMKKQTLKKDALQRLCLRFPASCRRCRCVRPNKNPWRN